LRSISRGNVVAIKADDAERIVRKLGDLIHDNTCLDPQKGVCVKDLVSPGFFKWAVTPGQARVHPTLYIAYHRFPSQWKPVALCSWGMFRCSYLPAGRKESKNVDRGDYDDEVSFIRAGGAASAAEKLLQKWAESGRLAEIDVLCSLRGKARLLEQSGGAVTTRSRGAQKRLLDYSGERKQKQSKTKTDRKRALGQSPSNEAAIPKRTKARAASVTECGENPMAEPNVRDSGRALLLYVLADIQQRSSRTGARGCRGVVTAISYNDRTPYTTSRMRKILLELGFVDMTVYRKGSDQFARDSGDNLKHYMGLLDTDGKRWWSHLDSYLELPEVCPNTTRTGIAGCI
jgi:hypothetical protein